MPVSLIQEIEPQKIPDKQLGVISKQYNVLVDQLINNLLISRVVLIANDDRIRGFYDAYMKMVFIATNAVHKSRALILTKDDLAS